MATTRTGSFPIGYRRTWGDWQKELDNVIAFARENDFECVDVGPLDPAELRRIADSGLQVGSADMKDWPKLTSADGGKRKAAVEANVAYMKQAVDAGVRNFFVVVLPEDPAADRQKNFQHAVDSYGAICQGVAGTGARIAIEGWPGPSPHHPALACTPESYRALFREVGSEVMGVNFDPSHLIRMGIDPVRFLDEFGPRVAHVHGKDTEILDEAVYEFGNLQPATEAKGHGFGGHHWRYTLPGHGQARWTKMLRQLVDVGYQGLISIELEDENFMDSAEDQQLGFIASRDFLKYV